jgi:hypothetical protein
MQCHHSEIFNLWEYITHGYKPYCGSQNLLPVVQTGQAYFASGYIFHKRTFTLMNSKLCVKLLMCNFEFQE